MTIVQALLLGLIQGLTEFLPVSSTGHLVLFQKILGFSQPPVTFDILVHLATLVAVIFFFRHEILKIGQDFFRAILKGDLRKVPEMVPLLVVGTLPALAFGLFLNNYIEWLFDSLFLVGVTWLASSGLMFAVRWLPKGKKTINEMTYLDSFSIGVFQAIAILPAVSRSGATIFGALWRKMNKKDAFNFSFLLSIPAILGAAGIHLKDLDQLVTADLAAYFWGFVVAAISGYLALHWFRRSVIEGKLVYFGLYCLVLGLVSIGMSFW